MNTNKIKSPRFAYLIGAFLADGCLYLKNRKYPTFEFYDGTSVTIELKYSLMHIKNIERIVLKYFKVKTYINKRDNRYILYFKGREFANILINNFSFKFGKKSQHIDVPSLYRDTALEKYFWLGIMDCDGMVARKSRKVALEVKSKSLINSFSKFLKKSRIGFKYSERAIKENKYYRITIQSTFIRSYYRKIGFLHPRKKIWIRKHIRENFYLKNAINIQNIYENGYLNYTKLFLNTNVYVENGKDLLNRHSCKTNKYHHNISFNKLHSILKSKGLNNNTINKEMATMRFKMGKGSIYSIKLPCKIRSEIEQLAKVVRFRSYGIIISRNYLKSLNIDYRSILDIIHNIFEIDPHFTKKGEPIYCSGVVNLFFSKIINSQIDNSVVNPPVWYNKLK